VIAVVVFLTSGAATLALSLLVETDAPYDHAFAAASGAHLTIVYDPAHATPAQIRHTRAAAAVTASAGPWPEVLSMYAIDTPNGETGGGLAFVGRSRPDAAVDRLTLEQGQWASALGQAVVSRRLADNWDLALGSMLKPATGTSAPALTVVGIAASVNPFADAWVLPAQISHMTTRAAPLQEQMVYRVSHAQTDAQLRSATQKIAGNLPGGAVTSVQNYLSVKRNADITTAVMIPFLLAFSAFALVASGLIIANVVSGVIVSTYRDIGVMKAIGFTPGQVVTVLLGQVFAPAVPACLLGIAGGGLLSQPFLASTAHALGLPAPFTLAIPVDLGVFLAVAVAIALSSLLPAQRAARLRAVEAITLGTAPPIGSASALSRSCARLPLPSAIKLGLSDSFVRPARSFATVGAILTAVTAVVFAMSMNLSLGQVARHLVRDAYVQADVYPMPVGGPGKPGAPQPVVIPQSRVLHLIRNDPATKRFVAEGQDDVSVPGLAEAIPYIGYRGHSSWLGFALISGRWFSGPGEAVAPTRLLVQAHLSVGQTIPITFAGARTRIKIVGEILDQDYDNLLLRGSWSSLKAIDLTIKPQTYEVQLRSGSSAGEYATRMTLAGLSAEPAARSGNYTGFNLIIGVVAGLALVLVFIALAGVFNTVILSTRERSRDLAILKAVGMAPHQVVTLVLMSVAGLGIVAGVIGIPMGLALNREVLQLMGQIASGTNIPPSFFNLIKADVLPLLALSGVVIALLGAWIPAQWAASSRVAGVLQAE
jgi:putative ABC transport system permease protein